MQRSRKDAIMNNFSYTKLCLRVLFAPLREIVIKALQMQGLLFTRVRIGYLMVQLNCTKIRFATCC